MNTSDRTIGQRRRHLRRVAILSLGCLALVATTTGTQTVVANGDTRALSVIHMHTKEELTVTYKRNGYYDASALEKLNWALRDWRRDEPTKMDPRLFDILWAVHRETGSGEPFRVVSAYRSPQTNAMLRRRSSKVAEHSQHMLGKAMDFYLADISPARIREVAMRMQRGGVGYYPSAYTPFTHLDVGSVRSWPRMTRDQLARVFPDGKTVHIPADGKPLEGYEVAKAEILARGGSVAGYAAADFDEGAIMAGGGKSLWAMLFGGGEEEEARPQRGGGRRGVMAGRRATPPPTQTAALDGDPLGRFQVAQAPAPEAEPVPLKQRLSARNRRRGAAEEKPQAEEPMQVAALAEPAKPSPAAQAQAAAELARPPAKEPVKPALIDAPMPTARPRNLPDPASMVAAFAPDSGAPTDAGRLVLAPAPPSRPVALQAPVAAATFTTASAETRPEAAPVLAPMPPARPVAIASLPAEPAKSEPARPEPAKTEPARAEPATNAPLQGKLVRIEHPAPPERPRLAALDPTKPAVPAATAPVSFTLSSKLAESSGASEPAAAEKEALRALFASARPSPPAAKPRVIAAKTVAAPAMPAAIVQEEAPAAALGFARATSADMRTDRFSGPAVKPLPTNFVQQ